MRGLAIDSRYDWGWNQLADDAVYLPLSDMHTNSATYDGTGAAPGWSGLGALTGVCDLASGTAGVFANTKPAAAAGETWTAMGWALAPAGRHVHALIEWFDNSAARISNPAGAPVATDPAVPAVAIVTAVAPAGTASVRVTLYLTDAAVGDQFTMWGLGLGRGPKDPAFWTPPQR